MRTIQRSFQDLGTPLWGVEFCFVDLETTGGSPLRARITEVGAVRYAGGERRGSFQSLVDPGEPIPRFITHLTGIDDLLVRGAPPIEAVLPSFLEFASGAVLVAHNASFDLRFLRHEAARLGYPEPAGPPVCTAKLARRIVGPDVPNVRLATVAEFFRTGARPEHRALADAEACAEVFHNLLELGGRLGILTLGELRRALLPQATTRLPSAAWGSSGPSAKPSPRRAGSSQRSGIERRAPPPRGPGAGRNLVPGGLVR